MYKPGEATEFIWTTLTVSNNFPLRSGEILTIRDGRGKIVEEWEVGSNYGHPVDNDGKEIKVKVKFGLAIRYF